MIITIKVFNSWLVCAVVIIVIGVLVYSVMKLARHIKLHKHK